MSPFSEIITTQTAEKKERGKKNQIEKGEQTKNLQNDDRKSFANNNRF
jgi:hypothetical protein